MGVIDTDMDERAERLKAPFPWFGGKSRAADIIWRRFGDVDSYNEPFAGSLAVLLARPHVPRVETVNDKDAFLSNFWRALQADPDAVAYWADYPVNEADLHARHRWLVFDRKARAAMERVRTDPHYFNAKIAGWWVWGQCLWIGSGWCSRPDWSGRGCGARADRGIHSANIEQKRPKLRERGDDGIPTRRWNGGGAGGGSGVHAPSLTRSEGLYHYMRTLAQRLRRVRVCCGEWDRVLTPSVTTYIGICGVVLDPPYDPLEIAKGAGHDGQAPSDALYNFHAPDVSARAREWAIANGDDPNFRIALCGYEGEHTMPETWECVAWKAHGGYSRTERGKANRERERIWFSPHCLKAELPLFAGADDTLELGA